MNQPYRYSGIISEVLVKRKLFDYCKILLISISPVLAIVLSSVGNLAGRAQESEMAGLIPASIHPLNPLQNPLPNPSSFPLTQSLPPSSRIKQGRQVSLNGRILPLAWTQQPANSTSANIQTWIADVGLMQSAGVDLLNTADSTKQPVQWFDLSLTETRSLIARSTNQYRLVIDIRPDSLVEKDILWARGVR